MQRWRTAEVAVKDWLNSRGWSLEDVSRQNLGYDLTGADGHGQPVHIEVKKVDRPDARFSLTNNEMGAMQSGLARYFVAIVIGDDSHAVWFCSTPVTDRCRVNESAGHGSGSSAHG